MEQMSQMTNTMGNMCYVIAPAPVVANLMGSSGPLQYGLSFREG